MCACVYCNKHGTGTSPTLIGNDAARVCATHTLVIRIILSDTDRGGYVGTTASPVGGIIIRRGGGLT